ncbi:MAG: class I adenylate-forming enzyme family protein [Phycisphaerales bacterium JB043]
MSVHIPILRRLLRHPLRVVCVDDQRTWKGFELLVATWHIAREISRRSDADHVALLLPTGGLFAPAALAGWMLGKVVVPLNYLLKPEEIDWIIEHSEVDCVVTVGPILDALGYEPKIPTLRLDEMSFKGLPPIRRAVRKADDDLAVLLYTSGTSGRPKGVMLSHGNITSNVRQIQEFIHFTQKDIILGALPQFHSFGFTVLTMLPLMVGMKTVYTARWVPTKVLKLIRQHHPTFFVGLPSMYNALLRLKDATRDDFESFQYVVSGGEPLPDAVFDAFEERYGKRILEGYGLTETAPVTNWLRPSEFERGSVGLALPDVRVRIVSQDNEHDLEAGQDGEIRLAGPNIMRGYFKDPEQTAQVMDEQGYFKTGDMGQLDGDGKLRITGRIKEMLIIGGENVFPREIEEILNRHPDVHDSAVLGQPDPSRGERAVAFVELVDGAGFDESKIRDFCFENLPRHKAPAWVKHVDALPRNPTGKIMRRALKDQL